MIFRTTGKLVFFETLIWIEFEGLLLRKAKYMVPLNLRVKMLMFLLLICFTQKISGQHFNTDSALAAIAKMKDDTSKIRALRKIGSMLEETDTAQSKKIYWETIELSKKIKSDDELCQSLNSYGNWHINMGHYDTAEIILRSALEIAVKEDSISDQAIINNNIGNTFTYRIIYDSALYYYIAAENLFDKNKDFRRAAVLAINISSIYTQIKLKDKAKEQAQKAVDLSIKMNDTTALGRSYGTLAVILYEDSSFTESIKMFKKALPFLVHTGSLNFIHIAYTNIASAYFADSDYNNADIYIDSSIVLAKQLGKSINLAGSYLVKARVLTRLKKYSEADKIFALAWDNIQKDGSNLDYKIYYNNLGELHLAQGKYKEAYEDIYNKDIYNAKVVDEDIQDRMQEMDAKYQSQKKQSQIAQLEKDKELQSLSIKQKNTFNALLGIGLLAAGIIGFLFYRNAKRKQQLARQTSEIKDIRIKELEQEKQLVAVSSILEGQEAERSRMAKDLHDGLGGMLSGIKLNLSSMKGNMIIQETDAQLFTKSITQLDNAIAEMRRVAHNMMPEALLKFGLSEAIQDYCDGINESNTVKMKFTQLELQQPLEKSTEVILYRIVQELCNNAIKHAAAKNIFIQLTKHERGITLTIEDDGKGFDTTRLATLKGAGLQNVQSRVDYLKGSFTVDSEQGKGTSIIVEIPV